MELLAWTVHNELQRILSHRVNWASRLELRNLRPIKKNVLQSLINATEFAFYYFKQVEAAHELDDEWSAEIRTLNHFKQIGVRCLFQNDEIAINLSCMSSVDCLIAVIQPLRTQTSHVQQFLSIILRWRPGLRRTEARQDNNSKFWKYRNEKASKMLKQDASFLLETCFKLFGHKTEPSDRVILFLD